MSTTISSSTNLVPLGQAASVPTNSSIAATTEAEASSPFAGVSKSDQVLLTEALAALQQASSNEPPVNTARVQQLQQAIDSGTYKIQPRSIAEKMVDMERLLHP